MEGVPILMLHGLDGTAREWDAVRVLFADRWPVFVFDLRELRTKERVDERATARLVLTELERRGVARAHVIGHSAGAHLAMMAAELEKTRIASLVLVGAVVAPRRLAEVGVPHLVVRGARDVVGPREGDRPLVVLDAGHAPHVEAPEEFARVVRAWLEAR